MPPKQPINVNPAYHEERRLRQPHGAYTRFVSLFKGLLWLFVGGVVAVVMWIASSNTGEKGSRMVLSSAPQHGEETQPVMLKPRYQGVDIHNQPYTVIADRAIQKDANNVELQGINADMLQENGKWLALNAKSGQLNTQTKKMDLSGGVSLFADGGYEFGSDHAHVDIQSGEVTGDSKVTGQGPAGTLLADSFSANSKDHVVHFNGSVRVTLYH